MNIQNSQSPEKKPFTLSQPWEKYLPGKEIRIIILIIIFLAVLYFFRGPIMSIFSKAVLKTTDTIVNIPSPVIQQKETVLSVDKDTDGDGLADWQETLIGTNPNVADSEKDVPKELKDILNNPAKEVITTEDKLALNVYNRLQTDPKGSNITEAIQAATTKEILDLANSLDKNLPTYTEEDVILINDDPGFETRYNKDINALIKKALPNVELQKEIYEYVIKKTNNINIINYQINLQSVLKKLLDMPVTIRTSEFHANIISTVAHLNAILAKNYSPEDTTTTYASLLVFQKNLNLLSQSINVFGE